MSTECFGAQLLHTGLRIGNHWQTNPKDHRKGSSPIKGRVKRKLPPRLAKAKLFAVLSSPCHVERRWGFSLFADSCCFRDDAFGF
jgi:hypothetical protein